MIFLSIHQRRTFPKTAMLVCIIHAPRTCASAELRPHPGWAEARPSDPGPGAGPGEPGVPRSGGGRPQPGCALRHTHSDTRDTHTAVHTHSHRLPCSPGHLNPVASKHTQLHAADTHRHTWSLLPQPQRATCGGTCWLCVPAGVARESTAASAPHGPGALGGEKDFASVALQWAWEGAGVSKPGSRWGGGHLPTALSLRHPHLPAADAGVGAVAHAAPGVAVVLEEAAREGGTSGRSCQSTRAPRPL